MSAALLVSLREDENFQAVMKDAWKLRPVIPEYTPQQTNDQTSNLVERIKFMSAQRQGFDVLYRALAGQLKE